jgi:hypothetical protein
MRLLLAHRHDVAAAELAALWGHDAVLLTPTDLRGERMVLHVAEDGSATVALPSRPDVTSVLNRLAGVAAGDLDHVDPLDAGYAAAELGAFLRAFLLAWPGPVVNRPTATCLNGPGWDREQWAVAAAAAGLPVRPVRRRVIAGGSREPATQPVVPAGDPDGPLRRVTVVGDRWFGPVGAELGRSSCALAAAAGCAVLEVHVDGEGAVVHASAWPDLCAPPVAAAVAALLDGAP